MNISYHTKIVFDSLSDRDKLINTMILHRDAVNFCNAAQFDLPTLHAKSLHHKVYHPFRKKTPCLPSCYVIRAINECMQTYRTIKSKGDLHKLKNSPIKKTLSVHLDYNLYSIKGEIVSLTTIGGRIKVKYVQYPHLMKSFTKYKTKDPSLFIRNGEVFISFVFEVPEPPIEENTACGVDLGVRRFAATSEGNIFIDKPHNARRRKLRYRRRCLKAKKTKSSKRALNKLGRHEGQMSRNFDHHLSKQILKSTKSTTIVIENLSNFKRGKITSRVRQIAFYRIANFLTYKAPLYGKRVATVSPAYTSQINHRTGRKDGKRRGCRFVATRKSRKGCRVVFDADVNAAINIAMRYRPKLPISSCEGLDGQAVVNQPIVGVTSVITDKSIANTIDH